MSVCPPSLTHSSTYTQEYTLSNLLTHTHTHTHTHHWAFLWSSGRGRGRGQIHAFSLSLPYLSFSVTELCQTLSLLSFCASLSSLNVSLPLPPSRSLSIPLSVSQGFVKDAKQQIGLPLLSCLPSFSPTQQKYASAIHY